MDRRMQSQGEKTQHYWANLDMFKNKGLTRRINFDLTVRRWHKAIITDAEKKLGRLLKCHEKEFITSRGGCIALEMIHDTVKAADKNELESYLSSEWQQKK